MADQWGAPEGQPSEPGPVGPPGSFPPPAPGPATPPPAAPPPAGGNWGPPPAPPPGGLPPADSYPGAKPAVGWEPPPAVYQQYATAPPPGSDASPDGLRILTIVLSVVKAIPLVLILIGFIYVVAVAEEYIFGAVDGFEGAVIAIVLVFLLFVGIGALLLFFQIRSVLKNQMLTLAVVAGIMAVLDLLILIGSVADEDSSAGGVVLMLVVFGAQAAVAAWAIKLRPGSRL